MRTIPNTIFMEYVDKDGELNESITSTNNFVYVKRAGIRIRKKFISIDRIRELIINGVVVIRGKGKDEQDKQNL